MSGPITNNTEWPADAYAIGSYIQSTLAKPYLADLVLNSTDNVLDVGCGDGAFTLNIVHKVPHGHVLGIDSSINMVQLAQKYTRCHPNFMVEVADIMSVNYTERFDCIVSFWCLQWTHDMLQALLTIYKALKNGGQILIMCPTGEEGPYLRSFTQIKASKQFSELTHFSLPTGAKHLINLPNKLSELPFSKINCERILGRHVLPSLDIFAKYVRGIAHFQGQFSPSLIKKITAAMVEEYDQYCQKMFQGEYRFELAFYKITAIKERAGS